ncbi:unnamed protein product [Camellia sinensis]
MLYQTGLKVNLLGPQKPIHFHYKMCRCRLSIEMYHNNLGEIKQILKETQLEDSRKHELSSALHVYFKEWLYGNIRQLYCSEGS